MLNGKSSVNTAEEELQTTSNIIFKDAHKVFDERLKKDEKIHNTSTANQGYMSYSCSQSHLKILQAHCCQSMPGLVLVGRQ